MEQFVAGVFAGFCAGVLAVLVLNDRTDDRMRSVEDAMAERAMRRAEKRQRRLAWLRRGKKLWIWG